MPIFEGSLVVRFNIEDFFREVKLDSWKRIVSVKFFVNRHTQMDFNVNNVNMWRYSP